MNHFDDKEILRHELKTRSGHGPGSGGRVPYIQTLQGPTTEAIAVHFKKEADQLGGKLKSGGKSNKLVNLSFAEEICTSEKKVTHFRRKLSSKVG